MPEDPIKAGSFKHKPLLSIGTTPTGFEIALTYLLSGAFLVIASDAVLPHGLVIFSIITLTTIYILTALRAALAAILYLMFRHRPRLMNWIMYIAGVLIISTSLETDIDLRLRLWLSEDSFLSQAETLQRLPQERRSAIPSERHMRNYGLFTGHIYYIQDEGRTVWFKTEEGTWFNSRTGALDGGIVLVSEGEPSITGEFAWDHLYGPWWVWRYTD